MRKHSVTEVLVMID